jgi:hypothetical protein
MLPRARALPQDNRPLPQDNRPWMLAVGRRLKAEYDAAAPPVPERLAVLIKQLESIERALNPPLSRPPGQTAAC